MRAAAIAVGLTLVGDGFGTLLGSLPEAAANADGAGGLVAGSTVVLVASVVLTQFGYAAVGYAYLRRWLGGLPVSVPDRREVAIVAVGTVAAIATAFLLLTALELAGVELANQEFTEVTSPTAVLVLSVVSVLLIGPAEELLYRGSIQGRLRQSFGPAVAVGGASLLFAAVHVTTMQGTPAGMLAMLVALFGLSVVYGLVYERTGNLVVPMLVHGLYDALIFGVSYAPVA